MDREAELLKESADQKAKIEKLQKYIAHLETDGDRLNRELTIANSYRECYDKLNLPVPILVVDDKLNVHYANRAFCDIVEISQDVLKSCPPLASLLKNEVFTSILRKSIETKTSVVGEKIDFMSPSERRFKLTLDAIPMLNLATGEVLGGFEVLSEVHEHTQQQYMMLNLSNQEFAISVKRIRCIVSPSTITKMPTADENLLGVINLRGEILPIIDIKKVFGLERLEKSPRESVIILDLRTGSGTRACGFLVDSVNEMITIDSTLVDTALDSGTKHSGIGGIAIIRGNPRVIIDAEGLFNSNQAQELVQNTEKTE
jgi:purine-binding chemotaxis protein CheW